MSGSGTILDPWDLATALTNSESLIYSGDTVLLRSGTYSGDFTCSVGGVTFKAYPGERPIIDGLLTVNSPNTRFWGIEFMNSGWPDGRESGDPLDITLEPILNVSAVGTSQTFINCIMHDGSQGCAWFADGGLMYGCLLYYNGYKWPNAAQGHGIYPHYQKTIKDCIIFDNFGFGIHAYSSTDGTLDDLSIIGNTIFNNGSLFGEVASNLLVGGQADVTARRPIIQYNMTYWTGSAGQNGIGYLGPATDVTFENNYTPEHTETAPVVNFLSNTGNTDSAPGSGKQVFVRENEYQSDRANVTVYNWDLSNTVEVDLSAVTGLVVGNNVNVHNVQDYFVDIQVLTLDANKKITVNMQAANRTIATPQSWVAPAKSFPEFGAFVVEKA